MSRGTSIRIDTAGLDEAAARFAARPEQIDTALRRSLRKTLIWTSGQARKALAGQLGVTRKAIGKRIGQRVQSSGRVGVVHFGLNPLPAHLAGNASQSLAGVQVGKRNYRGAFLASVYTAEQKVWIRLHSRHFRPDLYPYKPRRNAGHVPEHLRGRFPVVLTRIPLDTPEVHGLIREQATRAGARLLVTFEQEMNYEVNVRGRP